LLDQKRARAEKAERSRQYGIKQKQFQETQKECDDIDKLKEWSIQRRKDIQEKVVGGMPNLEPGHCADGPPDEEQDEFKDEQLDGFGIPDAKKEGIKRKKLFKKREDLRLKKELAKKRMLDKKGPREKSKAEFVRNKQAALRKELANAGVGLGGQVSQQGKLQLEKADLAGEFRMSLQVSAMTKWREDERRRATKQAPPANERERFARAKLYGRSGSSDPQEAGGQNAKEAKGPTRRRMSITQCSVKDEAFQRKLSAAVAVAADDAEKRKDGILDRQKQGLHEFHQRIREEGFDDAQARGKKKVMSKIQSFKNAFSSGRVAMEHKKKEMRTKRGVFASRARMTPNTRDYFEVSSTVPLFKVFMRRSCSFLLLCSVAMRVVLILLPLHAHAPCSRPMLTAAERFGCKTGKTARKTKCPQAEGALRNEFRKRSRSAGRLK
jgi:hypothetical protein